jgi:predicted phage terminase large subunit-like protein
VSALPIVGESLDDLVLQEYLRRKQTKKTADSFLDYVQAMWPWFQIEEVHCLIAEKFETMRRGEISRLMLNLPPRAGKSLLTSVLLPTWWMGHMPRDQVIQISHNKDTASDFGRGARNLLEQDAYRELFKTELAKDSRATASWATTAGGIYRAAGVGSGIAGKGFNLGVIDDPVNEQDQYSDVTHQDVWKWYPDGFYTRRQPDRNAIVLCMTRWRNDDLAGQLLALEMLDPDADKWDILKVPALLDEETAAKISAVSANPKYRKYLATEEFPDPIAFKVGDSFEPRRMPKEFVLKSKKNMTKKSWAALYQQSPYDEDGGIFEKKHWRKWRKDKPPACDYVIQVYDTAFEEGEENDYSARTTWGIFRREEDRQYCVILLERWKDRVGFPALRTEALRSYKEYQPDRVLIEKKASGHSLIQELRRAGVPIKEMKPNGKSKTARGQAVAVVLENGHVYYMDRKWAEDVIHDCMLFPNGGCKDIVDTVIYAWLYLRRSYHLYLEGEEDEDAVSPVQQAKRYERKTYYEARTATR